MPISSDISDMHWLRQPNPGEFGLRSMQVGLEAGRSFMSAYNAARDDARQEALMPLRQQMMQYQVKSAALDLEAGLRKQQDDLMSRAGRAELARVANEISANAAWSNPKSEAAVWDVASKYPSLLATPDFKNLVSQFDAAGAAAIKARDAETRAAKVEGELGIKGERIALQADALRLKDDQVKAEIASREKIAAESNATKLEVQKLRNEAASLRVDREAKDRLDDMEYRAFSEIAKGLAAKAEVENWDSAKLERSMRDAMTRAMEGSKARKAEGKDTEPSRPHTKATLEKGVTGALMDKGVSLRSTNEVIRSGANGRRAVFDATTKKLLRYLD